MDERFVIFKTKKFLEESSFQSSDIMAFVASEKHRLESTQYDKRCCVLLVEFWKAVGEHKVDVARIRMLADQIAAAAELASSAYQKLLKLRPNDAQLLETCAGFIDCIGNDPEEARRMRLRAQDILQRTTKLAEQQGTMRPDGGGLDWDSGILTVSASGGLNNGCILSANTQVITQACIEMLS